MAAVALDIISLQKIKLFLLNSILATQGIVWGVVDVSALVPGGSITLNLNSASLVPEFTTFTSFTNGMNIYVQVDSAHADNISFGAVLEDHEVSGGTYNNIANIIVALPDSPITQRDGLANQQAIAPR